MSSDTPVILDPIRDEEAAFQTAYEFLQVNGFIYRCNTKTGETWRLEANPADKKAQVWKKVSEINGRA